jgi:hypothetical protein
MGVLTQAMTRLRDEIVSSSQARKALRDALIRQTSEQRAQVTALCSSFAHDRAGARLAWSRCRSAEDEAEPRAVARNPRKKPVQPKAKSN